MFKRYVDFTLELKNSEVEELYQLFNEKSLTNELINEKLGLKGRLNYKKKFLNYYCVYTLLLSKYTSEKLSIPGNLVVAGTEKDVILFNKQIDEENTILNVTITNKKYLDALMSIKEHDSKIKLDNMSFS